MRKTKLLAVLSLLSFVVMPMAFAGDIPSAMTPADASKKNKTMAGFIADAESGFREPFSTEEVLTVMNASRRLKKEDREFSRKLERIATKMSNLR